MMLVEAGNSYDCCMPMCTHMPWFAAEGILITPAQIICGSGNSSFNPSSHFRCWHGKCNLRLLAAHSMWHAYIQHSHRCQL